MLPFSQHRFSASFIAVSVSLAFGLGLVLPWGYQLLTRCETETNALLNPLLRCASRDDEVFVGEYEDFEGELVHWIEEQKRSGLIDDVAVYFRDLRSGPWFGINERAEFVPSSLFKLPILIAVLRASESVQNLLSEEVVMSGAYMGLHNTDVPSETITPGEAYSVEELLRRMIVYSDNASQFVLKEVLTSLDTNGESLRRVYQELGMLSAYQKETLSVKSYASLFRVLYNARYLPPELSEKALRMLSESTFEDGLRRGVPRDVVIAHKFGIRDVPDEPKIKQLHDCGIVYHPARPYLICIMTRGSDQTRNADILGQISKRVYDVVSARTKDE